MIKEIKIEKGLYKGSETINMYIPLNSKWCCNNLVPDCGIHKGFCNYWTIIDTNLAKEINDLNYYSSIIELKDKSIFIINDVKPFHEEYNLEIVNPEYFLPILNNITIISFTENYNVYYVCKIVDMQHPEYTAIKIVYLNNCYNDSEETQLGIERKVDLNKLIHPFKSYSTVLLGDKAEDVWKAAVNHTLNKIGFQNENIPYIWNPNYNKEYLKDKFVNLIGSQNEEEEVKNFNLEYQKAKKSLDTMFEQFGITQKDLKYL